MHTSLCVSSSTDFFSGNQLLVWKGASTVLGDKYANLQSVQRVN